MRKGILVLLGSILTVLSVKAQVPDTAFVAVKYIFLYVADTLKPTETSSENMVLYIGKNKSVYKSYDRVLNDSARKQQLNNARAQMQAGGTVTVGPTSLKRGSSDAFYKDFVQVRLYRIERLISEYLIEEEMPSINWTILQETKEIQGLSCQKATTSFRGRNYHAWFCGQLPFNNGPWKLGSLPGLIIEAADDKNEVVFKFSGYEDVSGKHIAIAVPEDVIKSNDKEFKQLRAVATKDPEGFIRSTANGRVFTVLPSFSIIQQASKNPIERTPN